jgi:tetratricopeptide (TPR) repeat protein
MPCFSFSRSSVAVALFLCAASFTVFSEPTFDKLIADKKYKEAIDYAEDKLPAGQRDAATWVELAQANVAIGVPEKALACYLVAWRLDQNNYQAMLGAATIYNELGESEEALNLAKKALDKNFTAEASWQYARACIALKRSVEAKAALEKVIQGDSGNVIANKELGNIYFDEKSWSKALPLLKKSWQKSPDAELAYKIGKAYSGDNAPDSAIAYLKEAIAKGNAPEDAGLSLARALYNQGDDADAAAQYGKLSGRGMVAIDFYQAAVAAEKSNNPKDAEVSYEKAVSLFGADKSREALLSQMKVAGAKMDKKAYAAALANYQFVVEADPKATVVPDGYFQLADAYQALNNGAQAIATLEKYLSVNSKSVEAYARLAELYQKSGMTEKAKHTLETLISLSPNDPSVYLTLGQYYLKAKKYAEAFTQFEKSNSLKKSAPALSGMAMAAWNLKRIEVAKDAAKSAIALDPTLWDPHVVLADILMQEKDYLGAVADVEYMVKTEPGNIEYKQNLAVCYEQNNEKEKLHDLDKEIVAKSSTDVPSRLRLARDDDARNDLSGAQKLYKEVVALEPKNAEALSRLSAIALGNKQFADAAGYLARYLELKPTAEGERDYGDILYQLKDYDKALIAYRSAIKMNPAIKGFYKRYAEIVIAKGQQEEVITALSNVIKSGEADVGTYQTLGMIYQKKANYPKAIEMYQKALQADPQSIDALSSMAACQASAGATNDAIISYEQVVMMDTNAAEAYRDLGDIYYKQNDMAAAAKNYKRYFARSPKDQMVAKKLGKYSFDTKDYAGAVKYLAALQYQTEDDAEYAVMYAAACGELKQYKDAIKVLEPLRALKFKGKANKIVLKALAEAYEKDGQDLKAAEVYGAYCAVPGTSDPDASYKEAFLMEKSNPAAARKIYEANSVQFPKDYRNFLRLGIMDAAKPELLPKAVVLLKKTAALAESVPAVWLELGKAYRELGDQDAALEAYRTYNKTDPQNPESNKQIGLILANKDSLMPALTYLEVANMMAPNDPDVMAAMARGYAASNRPDQAIELLKKAKAAKPKDPDIRYNLFDLLRKTGQNQKAADEIKELIDLKRDNKYLQGSAEVSIALGDLKSAENTVEDILATEADNIDVLMLKAKIETLDKNYKDAINTYMEIQNINPNYAPSLCERANVYLLQSKVKWAETFYQRALKADPKYALAELGLARLAKVVKDQQAYQDHMQKALALDPTNKEILDEQKAGK